MKSAWLKWSFVPAAILFAGAALPVMAQSTSTSTQSATTATNPDSIKDRRENQQDRIAQGVKSGQLTAGETAKLEKQQQGINKQVASDRKANGGTLTASEKKQVNKEQNQASRNIYKKKHNAATQPNAKKP